MGPNPWVCIASGFSLTAADIAQIGTRAKLATAGLAFRLCEQPVSIHFAADTQWWNAYGDELRERHPGAELWTSATKAAKTHRIHQARVIHERNRKQSWGWSTHPGHVYSGGFSGYMLLQVVGWQKPSEIILLGYDCQHGPKGERHFPGGDYPNFGNVDNIEDPEKLAGFAVLAEQCPIPIINCSGESRLSFFPKTDIRALFP